MKRIVYFILMHAAFFSYAQVQVDTLSFSLLRQNDQIHITQPENTYQKLKQLSFSKNSSLSFGGSYRFQTEGFINEGFVTEFAPTKTWFLNRAMLHSHLKLNSNFEFFAELNSSTIINKEHFSPVDKDELNVNQLFAKYNFHPNWHLLIGRQNLRLGSARLVDVREGPNVRLSFNMAEVEYNTKDTRIKGFYSVPVQQKPGIFDNETLNFDENFSSIYWTQRWSDKVSTDLYSMYKEERNKTWSNRTSHDKRFSFGLRTFGNWNGINYNNEFIYQLGKFGKEDINAWTISLNFEKQFNNSFPFTVGIKGEAISGDEDSTDNVLNTFDGMYPRGAYFGRVAYFGPSNLIDIHPYIKSNIRSFGLEFDYEAFWRYSTDDGIYNPALILTYPSDNNRKFIGHQVGAIVGYTLNKHLSIEGEANIIYPGEYLKNLGDNETLYHFVFTTEFKF